MNKKLIDPEKLFELDTRIAIIAWDILGSKIFDETVILARIMCKEGEMPEFVGIIAEIPIETITETKNIKALTWGREIAMIALEEFAKDNNLYMEDK